uniref:Odorant-binding protein 12 n=1 Tax=Anopheles christyi TaxID=43041 RepID=A0A182KGD5_9DIPT
MVAFKYRFVLLPLVLIGASSLMPYGGCQLVDTSKVTLSGAFYTLFGCARDLEVPNHLIKLYEKLIFPDDQLTCCVFRCFGMRLGIYDDVNGLDVDKQYERVKDRLSIDEETYKRGIRNCIRNVLRGRTLNNCEKAYLILNQCQGDTITNSLNQQLLELSDCD